MIRYAHSKSDSYEWQHQDTWLNLYSQGFRDQWQAWYLGRFSSCYHRQTIRTSISMCLRSDSCCSSIRQDWQGRHSSGTQYFDSNLHWSKSSAYMITWKCSKQLERSLTYMRKRRGLMILPWGSPNRNLLLKGLAVFNRCNLIPTFKVWSKPLHNLRATLSDKDSWDSSPDAFFFFLLLVRLLVFSMLFIAVNSPNLEHQHWEGKKTVKCPNSFD